MQTMHVCDTQQHSFRRQIRLRACIEARLDLNAAQSCSVDPKFVERSTEPRVDFELRTPEPHVRVGDG